MKVKCISQSNNSKFPILNKTYDVFGVDFFPEKQEMLISIYSEMHDSPVLVELKDFEIINNDIPPDWIFRKFESTNAFILQPKEFTGNFWDDYHDGDPEAEKIFQEVERKIKLFHGESIPVVMDELHSDLSALAIGDNWVLCPECNEAFEVNLDDKVVKCPNIACNILLNNPYQ